MCTTGHKPVNTVVLTETSHRYFTENPPNQWVPHVNLSSLPSSSSPSLSPPQLAPAAGELPLPRCRRAPLPFLLLHRRFLPSRAAPAPPRVPASTSSRAALLRAARRRRAPPPGAAGTSSPSIPGTREGWRSGRRRGRGRRGLWCSPGKTGQQTPLAREIPEWGGPGAWRPAGGKEVGRARSLATGRERRWRGGQGTVVEVERRREKERRKKIGRRG